MLSLRNSGPVESSNGSGGASTGGVFNRATSFGRDCFAWVQSRLCCCLNRSDPDTTTAIERRNSRQLEIDAVPHFFPVAGATSDTFCFEQWDGGGVKNQHLWSAPLPDLSSVSTDDVEETPGGLRLLEGGWGKGDVYEDDDDALWGCFGLFKQRKINSGAFGTVYQYQDIEGTAYAVKIHSLANDGTTVVYHEHEGGNCYDDFKARRGEFVGLTLPPHPNVAKVHTFIMQDINSGQYIPIHSMADISEHDCRSLQLKIIISEYVHGIDLLELLAKRKSFEQIPAGGVSLAKELASQLAEALDFLHTSRKVIYRDLKPDNIIVTLSDTGQWVFKLVDFGLSKQLFEHGLTGTFCGSPMAIAPEMLGYEEDDSRLYSYSVDLWSYGILLWETAAAGSRKEIESIINKKFAEMFPNEVVTSDMAVSESSSVSDSDCLSTKLVRMGGDIIGQLFDASIAREKNHPDAPLLKKMVTGLLALNPDERMRLGEVRTLLREPASLS
ncbi:protein kinase domain-containing protein [Endozoicomonas elysicola]|uniref:Protein kinase domain-containing protein n=1 Tax=Endozoicomonas elysicola TaxID=305900 RepID=A0A081KAK1_9GAMM|nr:protein kinase [Endozoicomonas elysicola]KEI71177.1 hypothetical protein GV64_10865 [Endozoicomonas elysicola]